MVVSFDFDFTLSMPQVQQYARDLHKRGIEVWICTARYKEHNDDLYWVADHCFIKREHIIFTEMDVKVQFLKDLNPIWHLDDDRTELEFLRLDGVIHAIDVKEKSWKEQCEILLRIYGKKDNT